MLLFSLQERYIEPKFGCAPNISSTVRDGQYDAEYTKMNILKTKRIGPKLLETTCLASLHEFNILYEKSFLLYIHHK